MKLKAKYALSVLGAVVAGLVLLFGIGIVYRPIEADPRLDVQAILNDVRYLSSESVFQPLQYRVAGMDGEKLAAETIKETFLESGLAVEVQGFNFDQIVKENENSIEFSLADGSVIHPTTSEILSNRNIDQVIRGRLVNLGRGSIQDYELMGDQINGNFILIRIDETSSGDYFSSLKLSRRVKGIIAYDPDFIPPVEAGIANEFVLEKSRLYAEEILTVTSVTQADYELLLQAVNANPNLEISEKINYDVVKERRQSQNVIASIKGANLGGPMVVVGAHYDSVNAPGAADNAAGVAAVLELGRILAKEAPAYDVKLVAFGAEEVGLFGSNTFISNLSAKELSRCKLMINIDGPGLGNVLIIGKATGEEDGLPARETAFKVAADNRIYYKKLEFPDSDHFYFNQVGIPTITFASLESMNGPMLLLGNDPEYHDFAGLDEEAVLIPVGIHSLDDTYERIEESSRKNANFQKLFKVLLEVLDSSFT